MCADLFGSSAPELATSATATSAKVEKSPLRGSWPDTLLTNAIGNGRLGSALLFYGPEGVGKWKAALDLAAFLNCNSPDTTSALDGACGKCKNCILIAAGTHPDILLGAPLPSGKNDAEEAEFLQYFREQKRREPFHIVRWEKNATLSIDTARGIKARLGRKAGDGSARVAILYQLEKMRPEGMDALLRMVEEPPENTVIILISNHLEALPATIASRCQRLRFVRWQTAAVAGFLAVRNPDLPDTQRSAAARLAHGSPGIALELCAQESRATASDSSTSGRETAWLAFKAIFIENPATALDLLRRHVNLRSRAEVDVLVDRWESFYRDLIMMNHRAENVVFNLDIGHELRQLSSGVNAGMNAAEDLFQSAQKFGILRVNLRRNVSPGLALADLCFTLAQAAGTARRRSA